MNKTNEVYRKFDKYCGDGTMTIRRRSPCTGKVHTMRLNIDEKAYEEWQGGELIQKAMPDLHVSEREFVKTGMTPSDWRYVFKEDIKWEK
mgnify:CR=1 FL=1|tara:strand:- start:654 stop:923 length:270 start_codon:yes stop_codon:yes gene_type:complete